MISESNTKVLASAIRAGRGALNWSQLDLAEKSGLSLPTVARIEASLSSPKLETIARLIGAIQNAGVSYSWNISGGFSLTYVPKDVHPL